jgi:hypothetical protein
MGTGSFASLFFSSRSASYQNSTSRPSGQIDTEALSENTLQVDAAPAFSDRHRSGGRHLCH